MVIQDYITPRENANNQQRMRSDGTVRMAQLHGERESQSESSFNIYEFPIAGCNGNH